MTEPNRSFGLNTGADPEGEPVTKADRVAALLKQAERTDWSGQSEQELLEQGQSEQKGRLERARAVLRSVEAKQSLQSAPERNMGEGAIGGRAYGVYHVPPTVEDVVAALAETMKSPGWAAVVALPDIGWEAAAKLGVDTYRVVVIPDLKEETHRVLGSLVEGFETVVLGNVSVGPPQQRALAARSRKLGRTILTMIPWQTISKPFEVGNRLGPIEPATKRLAGGTADALPNLEVIDGPVAI